MMVSCYQHLLSKAIEYVLTSWCESVWTLWESMINPNNFFKERFCFCAMCVCERDILYYIWCVRSKLHVHIRSSEIAGEVLLGCLYLMAIISEVTLFFFFFSLSLFSSFWSTVFNISIEIRQTWCGRTALLCYLEPHVGSLRFNNRFLEVSTQATSTRCVYILLFHLLTLLHALFVLFCFFHLSASPFQAELHAR